LLSLSTLALPHPSTIDVRSLGSLPDRYLLEVTPTEAKRPQVDEPGYVARLKKLFGHMRLKDLESHHIYKYFDRRKDQAKDKVRLVVKVNGPKSSVWSR
jgi:hypothetical protein